MRRRAARSPAQTRPRTNGERTRGDCFDAGALLPITQQECKRARRSKRSTQMTRKNTQAQADTIDVRCCVVFTYSLLVRDVQLGFGVRLELVLLKPGVDPSVLHDLLQNSRGQKFFKDSEWVCQEPRFGWRSALKSRAAFTLDLETKRQLLGISAPPPTTPTPRPRPVFFHQQSDRV